jgi:succinyl-diaminopimelate desuccinylase
MRHEPGQRVGPNEVALTGHALERVDVVGPVVVAIPQRCPEEDFATEKARLFDLLNRLKTQGLAMEVEILQETPSSGVSEDHPMAKALADTIAGVIGKSPQCVRGSLEIRWYAQAGIRAFAYGPGLLQLSDRGRVYNEEQI